MIKHLTLLKIQNVMDIKSSVKVIDLAHFTSVPLSKTYDTVIKKNPKKIRSIFTFYNIKLQYSDSYGTKF